MLAKSTNEELILIELQHNYENDYFQRMIYGVSQLITSYIHNGDTYSKIKKAYSINIIYFDLGNGSDYIYEYKGDFIGMHKKDILLATSKQKQDYKIDANKKYRSYIKCGWEYLSFTSLIREYSTTYFGSRRSQ
ncbi:MAG: PD-(D/E)XK nuclease family transposase [Chitinophagaceae bacterium]|nr:PD-(D/E)XK nuclease family transposase [Chitinophagaceae bacterium]